MAEQDKPIPQEAVEGTGTRRVEYEFPKDPWERLGRVLASFNASPKAGTLLLLREYMTGMPYLKDEFFRLYAGTEIAGVNIDTPKAYYHRTLCPIGLVAEEISIGDIPVGYALTEAGVKYGLPSAAKILEFEKAEGFSIYPVFGSTNTSSKLERRAPLTRARILVHLALQGSQREVDIVNMLGIERVKCTLHLESLCRAGVIDYDSVNFRTGKYEIIHYEVSDPSVIIQPVRRQRTLTQKIVHIASELESRGIPITRIAVFELLTEQSRRRYQEKVIRGSISRILLGLAEQGFLKRGEVKGNERKSLASITDKGRVIADQLINPLLAALSDGEELDYLKRRVLPRVLTNLPEYARITGDLYYPYSRSGRMKERDSAIVRLLVYIEKNPGATIDDLAQHLQRHKTSIKHFLNDQLGSSVRREVLKGANRYFLKEDR